MSIARRILLGVGVVLGLILIAPFALLATGGFRLFYIPSEAMMPTYRVGDRFVARMSAPVPLRRGDVVLVRAGNDSLYVKRVAGLPGDRIQLIGGIVYLNGRPVPQRLLGEDTVERNYLGMTTARRLAERFPGEASAHEIYDFGFSPGDDFAEQLVMPGHVFTLGDNRDNSADSRFSRAEQGVEQVALDDVGGVPLFFYASGGRHRLGDDASH